MKTLAGGVRRRDGGPAFRALRVPARGLLCERRAGRAGGGSRCADGRDGAGHDARAARGARPDLAEWRRRIDRAFRASSRRGFVTYDEAPGWAAGVDEVIDALDDLCDAGHHDAAARLAEHAHRRADKSMQYVDDSDGWLSGFSERLSDLHLRACEAGAPDPAELAERLVKLELTSELDGFHRSASAYAGVLGESGLAEFRARLEPHHKRTAKATEGWSGDTFAVRQALVGWALGTGDPDALIEAHRRDRMLPDDVLEIAGALDRAGRGDEAVAWARRGLAEGGSRPWQVGDLREFLARKLRDRGDEPGAVELFWQAFVSGPSLSAYRRLLTEDDREDWLRRSAVPWPQSPVQRLAPDPRSGAASTTSTARCIPATRASSPGAASSTSIGAVAALRLSRLATPGIAPIISIRASVNCDWMSRGLSMCTSVAVVRSLVSAATGTSGSLEVTVAQRAQARSHSPVTR